MGTFGTYPPFKYAASVAYSTPVHLLVAHLLCVAYSRSVFMRESRESFPALPALLICADICSAGTVTLSLTFWSHLQSYRSFSYYLYIKLLICADICSAGDYCLLGYEQRSRFAWQDSAFQTDDHARGLLKLRKVA